MAETDRGTSSTLQLATRLRIDGMTINAARKLSRDWIGVDPAITGQLVVA